MSYTGSPEPLNVHLAIAVRSYIYCLKLILLFQVKNMKVNIESLRGEKQVLSSKTRPARDQSGSSSTLDLEKSVHQEPAIYSRVNKNVLAQHGGELLLHSSMLGSAFKNEQTWKHYYPGMIVVGTQVIYKVIFQ